MGSGQRAAAAAEAGCGGGGGGRAVVAETLYENDQLLLKFVLVPDVNGFDWLQACDCQFAYDICST